MDVGLPGNVRCANDRIIAMVKGAFSGNAGGSTV